MGLIVLLLIATPSLTCGQVAANSEHTSSIELCLSPPSLAFATVQYDHLPPPKKFLITGCAGDTLDWSVSENVSWLSVSPRSGLDDTSEVVVTILTTNLGIGTHIGTIFVSSLDAMNSPQILEVHYTVLLASDLFRSTDSASLTVSPPNIQIPDSGVDTSFFVTIDIELRGHDTLTRGTAFDTIPLGAGALVVPLEFSGHPGLRIDESVETIPGTPGITPIDLGANLYDPVGNPSGWWDVVTTQIDSANQTILIGFVNFGNSEALGDTSGSLCRIHFLLDSTGASGLARIDSTLLPLANFLSIVDTVGRTWIPQWDGGTIAVGDTAPTPHICLSPALLEFTAAEGDPLPPPQTFSISNCGTDTLTWSVSETLPWLSASPLSGVGNAAEIELSITTTDLTPGTHFGIVTVESANADNSPQTVQVDYTVTAPHLCLAPTSLSFSAFQNGALPAAQEFQIANCGGDTLNWEVAETADWLSVPVTAGTGNLALIMARITTTDLPPGVYHALITVTSDNADNSPQTIAVDYTVAVAPRLCITPTHVDFAALEHGPLPPSSELLIANCGGSALNWQVTESAAWLQVAPTSGSSDSATISVSVLTTDLSLGIHHATITITGDNADNSPQSIGVDYTVYSTPHLCLTPTYLRFAAIENGFLPGTKEFTIANCGGGFLNWQASETAEWLSVAPLSGSVDSAVITVAVTTTDLPLGRHKAAITVSSDNADNSPQLVHVDFDVMRSPAVPRTTDSAYFSIRPSHIQIPDAGMDTSFFVTIDIEFRGHDTLTRGTEFDTIPLGAGALVVPLDFSGHPGLRIDETVQVIPYNAGITPVDLGANLFYHGSNPDGWWDFVTTNIDSANQTILIGFVNLAHPQALGDTSGSLCLVHFVLDSTDVTGVTRIDSTLFPPANFLSIVDTVGRTWLPRWYGGTIAVGDTVLTPLICLSPELLEFSAVQSGPLPPAQTFSLSNCGEGLLEWSVTETLPWLSVAPLTGTDSRATITVSIDSTDLPPGRYDGVLTVTGNAENSPQTVDVSYLVASRPDRLYLVPPSLSVSTNHDTSFGVTVMLDLQRTDAAAITIPLTFAGSGPNLRIDTTITDGSGNVGVTHKALGTDSVWESRHVLVDNVNQTILIGYVDFGGALLNPPLHDSLVTIHFIRSAGGATEVIHIDTTTIPPANVLSIVSSLATSTDPGWTGGTITVGTVGLVDEPAVLPGYLLSQNYPNPFNSTTAIRFSLGEASRVNLSVYNVLGRKVATIRNSLLPAGWHTVQWDGRDGRGHEATSGLYFYRLVTDRQSTTKKMLLLR